jgi:signal peptidase II
VDFLDARLINFPIFNVADVLINVGLVCLFIGLWRSPQTN